MGRRVRAGGGLALFCGWWLLSLAFPLPAAAHTGFESSAPADDDTVSGPLWEIVLRFSGSARPVGDGFQVLTPGGERLTPAATAVDGGREWRLRLDRDVDGGVVGVRWRVQAPDAHPIEGAFSFSVLPARSPDDVATPAPAGPGSVDRTDVAGTGASDARPSDDGASADGATGDGSDPGVTGGGPADPDRSGRSDVDSGGGDGPATTVLPRPDDLDTFLQVDATTPTGTGAAGALGRLVGLTGTILALGVLAFSEFVLRPLDPERWPAVRWVAVAGLVSVGGWLVDLAARTAVLGGRWTAVGEVDLVAQAASAEVRWALGLRMFGALAMMVGALPVARRRPVAAAATPVGAAVAVVAVPGSGSAAPVSAPWPGPPPVSAVVSSAAGSSAAGSHAGSARSQAVVGAGAGLLALSYAFDGHTASEGQPLLTGVVGVSHVVAGAVWAGGVVSLGTVLWRRRRAHRPQKAAELATRFSVVAAAACCLAGSTGLFLAATILDSVDDLLATAWGRVLLAKIVMVVLAAGVGAHNHFRVVPELARNRGDGARCRRLGRTVAVEATILVGVMVGTALLIAADATGAGP